MNAAEMDFWGRHSGDGVDGSVQRPVRCVVRITGLSELASVEVFGQSASPKRRLRNFEDYVSARRGRFIPSRLRVPVPLAGKWIETGTTRADARPRGEPNPSPGHPVSATVHGLSRLELGHSWCARLSDVTPASRRMRLRSAKRGAG